VNEAIEEASLRLCSLSPRGPHASRTREGNSGGEDLFRNRRALLRTIDSVDCIIDSVRRNVLEGEAQAELDLAWSTK